MPTGLGKTAAVILSWIYRRRYAETPRCATPRRLVYCLPMRTLVEQTENAAREWLAALGFADPSNGGIALQVLMGGSDAGDWYRHPEQDVILVGTQDMLLSRALNRGYGMSRYQWPIHYSLLNNDCLWILDETQLMGVGLKTSAQLQGLRKKLGTYGSCETLWMSATTHPPSLATVDHPWPAAGHWRTEELQDDDRVHLSVQKLLVASKPLEQAAVSLLADAKSQKRYAVDLAGEIIARHQPATLTLIVLNRVSRAQHVFEALKKAFGSEKGPELRLIHSRFRSQDRKEVQASTLDDGKVPPAGRIVVATQAIEAGVDISATTMFTELAPWSSLVQRFGRCNRYGRCGTAENPAAQIFWIDVETIKAKPNDLLPYVADELDRSRQALQSVSDVSLESLAAIDVEESTELVHVIRRKDVLELFDTTPDLSGNDLDVSRYIRETEDKDLQVYWREWNVTNSNPKRMPPVPASESFPDPTREELCSVPIAGFSMFLRSLKKDEKSKRLAWVWNPLDGGWDECRIIRPGQIVLLHTNAGGYNSELGWTGDRKDRPKSILPPSGVDSDKPRPLDAMDHEERGPQVPLRQHLLDVRDAARMLSVTVNAEWDESIPWQQIITAAHWHDVGKAHAAFQSALRRANPVLDTNELWAKSGTSSGRLEYVVSEGDQEYPRRGFRHELASALAYLQQHDSLKETNLVTYLIAAHHGKVRLSIRSMPNETKPPNGEGETDRLFARGVWDGDELPAVQLGEDEVSESLRVDLSLMRLGEHTDEDGNAQASWLSRMLQLRDEYGPFRLAFLETLVRVADWRGSEGRSGK